MTQQFILDAGTAQPIIKQGCYVSHGGSLYVADADTAITGSPSDGSVYIRVSGTTSLTVEFITSLSGYVWNPVYNAMTNGIYTLLPYMIVKAGATWTRFNFNPNNQVFGEMKATSLDTGSGAMTFDQGVKTTDSPTFAKLKLTTSTHGSQSIASEDSWVVPVGIYQFAGTGVSVGIYNGSTWVGSATYLGAVISDGSNVRIYNDQASTLTIYYRKFS
jgi:hypothetical protein